MTTETNGSASDRLSRLRDQRIARRSEHASTRRRSESPNSDEPIADRGVAEVLYDLMAHTCLGGQAALDPNDPVVRQVRGERSQALVHRAGIPARHSIRDLNDTGAEHEQWRTARGRLIGRLGSGCLISLIGPRGTGKTQIAQQAVVHKADRGEDSLYVKTVEVFLLIRAAMRDDSRQNQLETVAEFIRPRLLIIDEIQERGETAWEDRMLNYIIDKRYDAMSDTILIGNLEAGELAQSLGASIADRMAEAGGVVVCNWGSFRRAGELRSDRP